MPCLYTGDKMNKKLYYNLQIKELEKISKLDYKPRLLLHSCCGPCNTYPMEYLSQYFDLTLYFNNHNIFPESEYSRRFAELLKYVEWFKQENQVSIEVVQPDYKNDEYYELLKHRADEKEGGKRCTMCFALRMKEAIQYADQHDFDYMTTVMTISRHKNSMVLNQIGERLQKSYPKVKYFYSDFKKNDGYHKSIQISRKHNMYRQSYCGCQFSLNIKQALEDYRKEHHGT